jgi:hypothetical protein
MSRATFTIEEVDTKESSRGPFKRAKLSGIGWVSVFAEGDQDFLEENLGQPASAEVVTNDKGFKNASAFQKASGAPSQAAGSETMSKAEWAIKDDKKRVGILYSVHLKQLHEYHLAHPEDPEVLTITSYKDIMARARKHAVEDLGWINGYATGDVPF